MNPNLTASMSSVPPEPKSSPTSEGVIEIGLLLPTTRAADLLKLARDRHVSVGQLLRKMIDRELAHSA